eukprot:TRINITY_DN10224_c3_g1_i1.p1 TRINITY_DN10224_c3_g1~~TRINITY_DN10224_c3_g1_i1.p1  ORF type:complete len:331 (-),score=68.93 TRINITY_DN10224_c3_g1_i1:162-1154(-)
MSFSMLCQMLAASAVLVSSSMVNSQPGVVNDCLAETKADTESDDVETVAMLQTSSSKQALKIDHSTAGVSGKLGQQLSSARSAHAKTDHVRSEAALPTSQTTGGSSKSLKILQAEALVKGATATATATAARATEARATATEAAATATAATAQEVDLKKRENKSDAKASVCNKITGYFVGLSGQCDPAIGAVANQPGYELLFGQCTCPEYTCFDGSKCAFSPSEMMRDAGSGAQNVASKATEIASKVPGLADSVGAAKGIWNSVSGIAGSITGTTGGCSGYVGVCFSQCSDPKLGFTATCSWGTCQCKPGFCAQNGQCIMDVTTVMQNFAR